MDEKWQDMPFEYWDPSSDGSGGTADMNAMFKVSSVVADGCEAMGKVTGGKTAKAGTKLTLKATANKGYVFSHWEGPLGDGIDPRNPSISYVVGESDVEFVAYFAPISDSSDIILQESYGPFVPGMEVELNLGLDGYTAKKLPSGLKLDKKTGVVKGKAKKPGEYQVTFTKKGAETLTAKFIVGPMPTITITMEGDIEKCKVTGASKPGKGYLVGKKVSLSAKGPKGTAFTGWFKDGAPWPNETEYLESKLKYVMTEENLSLVARFEKEKMSVSCDGLSALAVGEEVALPIAIETQSGVKSVKGSKLPTGLKVMKDKATGEWFVTGKPKKVGTWNSVINVTAKSGAVEQLPITMTVEDKGEVVLPSANHYFREPLKNGKGEKYFVSVGISNVEEFLPNLKLTKGFLNVSGLPEGLKYDAASGKIAGIATKPGAYTVTLTVTDGKSKYVSTITIEVEPLPEILVGTYTGLIGRDVNVEKEDPWMAYGMANVTVAANGKITAKMTLPCGTYSFSAAGWDYVEDDVYSAVLQTKNGDEFELVIDSKRNWKEIAEDSALLIDGYKEFRVPIWRNEHVKGGNIESDPVANELISEIKALKKVAFKVEGSKSSGYEVTEVAANDRSANLTVTFDTKGGVKYAGNIDGVRVSGSSFLGIDGDDYYTICDIVVPVGKTESVYIAFGIERDEDGELQFEVFVVREEF